jgi:hypothetical protein
MQRLIQRIDKDTYIFFDSGNFDDWCVYIRDKNGKRAPLDKEYFSFFVNLASEYSEKRVYSEFVSIYSKINNHISKKILEFIISLAKKYPSPLDRDVAINYIFIYAGMIAERNKDFAVLKERIKRLGMHQILIDHMSVSEAANFSKGKKWKELDEICKAKGF